MYQPENKVLQALTSVTEHTNRRKGKDGTAWAISYLKLTPFQNKHAWRGAVAKAALSRRGMWPRLGQAKESDLGCEREDDVNR